MRKIVSAFFLITCISSHGQLRLGPLSSQTGEKHTQQSQNARIVQNSLPFWDDFSITEDGQPDTLRIWGSDTTKQWNDSLSRGVYVNATLAIDPPTYRVITFDGLDDNGLFYGDEQGLTDELYSDILDLSGFTEADDIYLSFYWQAGGNVEKPDEGDSIRLQFYNKSADTTGGNPWQNAWGVDGSEISADMVSTFFPSPPIKLEQRFINDTSIFRFQSFGDQDGPFDAWHLDYIYLDRNRSEEEIIENGFDDAAFSNQVTSFLSPFVSMPVHQFLLRTDSLPNQRTSLSYLNELPIVRGDSVLNIFSLDVTYQVRLLNTEDILFGLQSAAPTLSSELDFADITLGLTDSQDSLLVSDQEFSILEAYDSAVIQTECFLLPNRIESSILDQDSIIDLTVNDTIRNQYLLHDFYAYDDGTAEYAVGVNERGNQVGVQFWVEEPDTLTQIDIYFPNIAPSSDGQTLTLRIFKNLGDEFPMRSEPITITTGSINEFTSYELSRPIIVSDTFYVTYEQDANQYIGVGFDRSNAAASPFIFENITDEWVRNERIQGALMIRPVFKNATDFTLGAEELTRPPTVYPNPSSGVIHISGNYDEVVLRDFSGRLLRSEAAAPGHDFSEYPRGLYLLTVINGTQNSTQKIVIQ